MKAFGLGVLSCGLIIFLLIRSTVPPLMEWAADKSNDYDGMSLSMRGKSLEAMWRGDPNHIVHVILFPWGNTLSTFTTFGELVKPLEKGVTMAPEGLYVDGQLVPRGKGRRVFIFTEERKMQPIPLTEEELKALLPPTVKKLDGAIKGELTTLIPQMLEDICSTEVWKEKIKPVLEEEAWGPWGDLPN